MKASAWPQAALAVAAALWLAALALPVTATGAGSSLTGHAFADLIGAGTLAGAAPRWVGPLWYAAPIAGGIVLLTLLSDHRAARRARLAAAGSGAATALIAAVLMTDATISRFGAGAWSATLGAALALLGVAGAVTTHDSRKGH